ncbi:MAG: CDP-diacylglycerol--glycerol-3-phosphate 3-phosphatidyltransferase [Shimia sp.]
MTLPNALTTLRLIAAPAVALVFLILPRPIADWVALILFVGASLTDYLDGYLARAWNQTSAIGAMLDPIADKAMVLIALVTIAAFYGLTPWIVIPVVVIVFREVFVSGLREYLGAAAGTLQVTKLAKWKTTVQMVAIAILLAKGIFEHGLFDRMTGMTPEMAMAVLEGEIPDEVGLGWRQTATDAARLGGITLLWIAALLTAITGWEYFQKARPKLAEAPK